jgi:hypothetical protein
MVSRRVEGISFEACCDDVFDAGVIGKQFGSH